MALLGLIGTMLYSGVSLVLGYRLLSLARRSRELPELYMGTALFCGGFLATTLFWSAAFIPYPEPWQGVLATMHTALHATGCVSLLLAAWKVFRPNRPWAGFLAGLVSAALLPYLFWYVLTGPAPGNFGYDGPRMVVQNSLYYAAYGFMVSGLIASYGWFAVECFLFRAVLGRRWRLGLPKDRLIANRIVLWGLGIGCISLTWMSGGLGRFLREAFDLEAPTKVFSAVLVLTGCLFLWLAYFPPASYRRWIRRHDNLSAKQEVA